MYFARSSLVVADNGRKKSIIKILLPLAKMTKLEVIKLAKKLDVPFKWTWSCYSDGKQLCGKYCSYRKREEAFLSLGYSQPKFSLL